MQKPKSLQEWFVGATKSGREHLTVPPRFTSLPCGCSRDESSATFELAYIQKEWRHCSNPLNLTTPHLPDWGKQLVRRIRQAQKAADKKREREGGNHYLRGKAS